MKKHFILSLILIGMITSVTAAPLNVQVRELLGSTVSDQTNITNAELQPIKEKQGLLSIGTGGDGVIEPGEQVTGTMTVTVNCG